MSETSTLKKIVMLSREQWIDEKDAEKLDKDVLYLTPADDNEGGGHIILDGAGNEMPQRTNLQIIGTNAWVEDNVDSDTTIVTIGDLTIDVGNINCVLLDHTPAQVEIDALPHTTLIFVYNPSGAYGLFAKSAYQSAIDTGVFNGTEEAWAEGLTPYGTAKRVDNFKGTEEEWVASLNGTDGKSPFEAAKEQGYSGTAEQLYIDMSNIGNMDRVLDMFLGEKL